MWLALFHVRRLHNAKRIGNNNAKLNEVDIFYTRDFDGHVRGVALWEITKQMRPTAPQILAPR